jgi:penicillin-binding protein 1A
MKTILKRLFWFLSIGAIVGALTFAAFVFYLTHDLPKLDRMEDYSPPQVTRVYDANNNVVAEFYIEKRTLVNVSALPSHVKYAFIAAEDADFYNHKGIDYVGVVRALINEVKYRLVGGQRLGGSTITQQTAKQMLLNSKKTYARKIREMILAHRIEEVLSKDEILNIYLNQIYFGNGAYGIEEAARYYYGVGAKGLTLGQAAALASVPKSPNRLNPLADPDRGRARRDYVLDQMVTHGFTSTSYAQAARKESIEARENPNPHLNIAPYFAEEIRKQLIDKFGEEAVLYHGLSVYTSLNSIMQKSANAAMENGLRAVDKRQGYRGPILRPDAAKLTQIRTALAASKKSLSVSNSMKVWNLKKFASTLKSKDVEEAVKEIIFEKAQRGSIVTAIVKSISNDQKSVTVDLGGTDGYLPLSKMTWARSFNVDHYTKLPSLPSDVLKSGDIVWVRLDDTGMNPSVSLEQEPLVSGALVSLDVKTGAVLSMVGGFDFETSQFNRATQAKRQPGSSFKPFIYSTAIDKQAVTAATIITDAPKVFFEANAGENWKPKNSTGRFLGDITVRTCLTRSVNTCSINLLEKIGVDAVRETAAKVGLLTDKTPFPRDLTLALGTAEVIPIDMVNAYRIFPNGGRYSPYVLFNKVKGQKGELLFESKVEEPTQVLRPETAFITTSILQGLMHGIGKSVTGLTQPLAGKTGTTNQYRSAWFSGYSKDVVTTVYVGFDSNQTLGPSEYGYRAALPIWGNFMSEALRQFPAEEFAVPEGITWRLIDQRTGFLADGASAYDADDDASTANGDENNDAAPVKRGVVREAFIAGTEPTRSQASSGPPPLEAIESGANAP